MYCQDLEEMVVDIRRVSMNRDMTKYILSLLYIKGVGPAFIKKKLELFRQYRDNIEEFKKHFHESLSESEKDKIDVEENLYEAEKTLEICEKNEISVINIASSLYPISLLELKDPPAVLYCKGNMSLLEKDIIAIIGTRRASELGGKIANKLGAYFSKEYAICNGLVDGIDRLSIINQDGVYQNVIGVLSGGLNFTLTSSKITQELASKTLSNNGLLLSEYEPNKKEDSFSGSKASRIQAGLAKALILVQSPIDGGSKYTVRAFKDLNRVLGVVNFDTNIEFRDSALFGANRLIVGYKQHGIAYFCSDKHDTEIYASNIASIKLRDIVNITSSDDYRKFSKKIKENKVEKTLFD